MGYIPDDKKDLANNLQVDANPQVLYTAPAGFHLVSTSGDNDDAYTVREILGGMIIQPGTGARGKDTPTAAALVAAVNGAAVNLSFRLIIRNTGNNTLTVGAGTGVTISGTATVATGVTAEYLFVFTNVTSGSEAVTVYTIANDHAD